jgi:uncharacterized protein (DUF1499 family)
MQYVVQFAIGLGILVVVAFGVMGWWSGHRSEPVLGVHAGQLSACPASPNCVSSESGSGNTEQSTVNTIALPDADTERHWQVLLDTVRAHGGAIQVQDGDYVHATFTSAVFRFIDDLELRREGRIVHVRSASRVGHSDLGANRKRVAAIQLAFNSGG